MTKYPIFFRPNIHKAIWGREEWLVSAHPSSPNVIANGEYAGKTLLELVEECGEEFIGTRARDTKRFPLLVKIIDAHDSLSVQVHPNEKTSVAFGGEPKTEMWSIVAAEPGGAILAGLKPGTQPADIERAVRDGHFENLVVRHPVRGGEAFLIPGGTVHAIGAGVKIFEVQQSSDTTYRLYDFGRKGADGKPRELHIKESLATIDYTLGAPAAERDIDSEFFRFRRLTVAGREEFAADDESFTVVYAPEGGVKLSCGDGEWTLDATGAALVPAGLAFALTADEKSATVFTARM